MSKPFKTLHLTNYYHKNSGGISTSFNNLMDAAARHQRQVRLIVPGEAEAIEDVNEFAKIYYVPAKYSPIFDKRYRLILPWQYMPSDTLIRKIMIDEMPDVVEVTDKYTLSMMGKMVRSGHFKELGRPILIHFSCERMDDNVSSFLSRGRSGKWLSRRVVGNYLLPSFDYHIANSTYTAEEFFEAATEASNNGKGSLLFRRSWRFFDAPRVPTSERVFICPRGVDAVRFTPERKSDDVWHEMRERANIPESSVVILYAGRISPEKNVELLVDIMKELAADKTTDFRLLVAGAGPKSDWLKEETDKLFPGKIVQLGHLDKDLLADYYANADVFVHPNPREPFGIAPLEAMASGVPTVAPRSGGILSYATDDNVWLVETDGKAFAEAIRSVIGDEETRQRKVANAVETARQNTRERSTDNLFAAYDRIYEDFHSRKELFTDIEKTKDFDYTEVVNV